MKKGIFVGECPFCKQGMQEILKEKASGRFFIECDECMAEWENPENAINNLDASRFKFGEAMDASITEVQGLKWDKYVLPKQSEKSEDLK